MVYRMMLFQIRYIFIEYVQSTVHHIQYTIHIT